MMQIKRRTVLLFGGAGLLSAAAPADVQQILAPSGHLRAAINFGNPVLAQRDPATGTPRGVSVDLAHALGQQLGVKVTLVPFDEAGRTVAALKDHAWDVAFLAIDPTRGEQIDFTPAYVEIEGAYLVPAASPLHAVADVDRPGTRVAVAQGSAYDLYLTRTLKQAALVRFPSSAEAATAFAQQHLEVLASVRQPLAAYAQAHPETRLLPGRFMAIDQAMALPKGHSAALAYLHRFIEAQKASGFVAQSLARSGQSAASVAPASP